MNATTPSLNIYDASAGSGKTFTLVKEYLKKILLVDSTDYYKQILAITFTNKAVGEMKKRIVEQLVAFADEKSIEAPGDMQKLLAEEVKLSHSVIQERSKQILRHLLHDYSGFSVETIDKFNHRIIRSFAKDLKLNSNFEVSLDSDILLEEAVDRLIAQAGQDRDITDYLLRYTYSKLSEDKSWDIRREIIETAGLLNSETNKTSIDNLKAHSLADFQSFAKNLHSTIEKNFSNAHKIASQTLDLLESMGVPDSSFSRASFPKFLRRAIDDIKNLSFSDRTQWQNQIESGEYTYYNKSTSESEKQQIDSVKNELDKAFLGIKSLIERNKVYHLVYRELLPMALINLVGNERNIIQEEQNILLIGDFNNLLHEQVKDQPAPFIYERLGERYRHFFIDEFQDTSQLQWENMLPLLDNALSQGFESGLPGSVMLVGDAKQSIYRWRGGYPQQFMDLTKDALPFQIETDQKKVIHLDTNYRSSENIIDFNNRFFTHTASILKNETYKDLYKIGNQQKKNARKGGYVHIERLTKPTPEKNNNMLHQEKVVELIEDLRNDKSVSLSDICILVRTNAQGVLISEALAENDIPIISSETLLLKSSREVNALLDSMRTLLYPEDKEARVKLCYYLYDHLSIDEDKHDFLSKLMAHDSLEGFLKALATYNLEINLDITTQTGLYQTFELLIKKLGLETHNSAYLFSFMEFVHHYEQTEATTKHLFFDYWNAKSDKLSIPSSKQNEAVQIMTIHKAKGLEFPIVLVPFANNQMGDLNNTSSWIPWQDEKSGFDEVYISIKDSLAKFNDTYHQLYEEIFEMEVLDELNSIYVAFTRASEELYIITDTYRNKRKTFPLSEEIEKFLIKEGVTLEEGEVYTFGHRGEKIKKKKEEKDTESIIIPSYTITDSSLLDVVTTDADLWGNKIQEAIEYGTQLHEILEHIEKEEDVATYFSTLKKQQIIDPDNYAKLLQTIKKVVQHEDLYHLFKKDCQVRTELDIVTADKQIRRVDRLNFHEDNTLTLVDYKTGAPKSKDIEQIESYAKALEEMGMKLKEKLLVYIDNTTVIVNKV
ncbi:MAG TPA: UvrD-helicase domain-containing protein [Flavobacteriaceae bacterium]|nr:UvrD-helicase domain-containing protein [Flavobacteriaceae bacterium]